MEFRYIIDKVLDGIADRDRLAVDQDGRMLVASIMVICAQSDGGISPDENLRMVELLRQRFDLRAGEALELITRLAEDVSAEVQVADLLESANRELSRSTKEGLMMMVIEVIAADRVKDPREILLLTNLVERLEIPDDVMERVYAHYFEMRNKDHKTTAGS